MASQCYAMNGGVGSLSYSKNSSYQRGVIEASKEVITQGISESLDIEKIFSNSIYTFRMADFGCSTGPNTFVAMDTIVEAVLKKFLKAFQDSEVLEFQALFNDRTENDFNTLFLSLPPGRKYYASGVPGSFYTRLFPKDTLHYAYSSCTINWLSEVPKAVLDPSSPAWNKGKIMYYGKNKALYKAYEQQFAKDFDYFLTLRAHELVCGGLIGLIVPTMPDRTTSDFSNITFPSYELLGDSLMDVAKKGLIDGSKIDTFNFPLYYTYPSELKALVLKSQYYSLEKIEVVSIPSKSLTTPDPKAFAVSKRAVLEGLLSSHFGTEVMDEVFNLFAEKIDKSGLLVNPNEKSMVTFVLLKRNKRMV